MNRVDIFRQPESQAAPIRLLDIHAEFNNGEFKVSRTTNAGNAFQNLKLSLLCLANLSQAALLDLEELTGVAPTDSQGTLKDV